MNVRQTLPILLILAVSALSAPAMATGELPSPDVPPAPEMPPLGTAEGCTFPILNLVPHVKELLDCLQNAEQICFEGLGVNICSPEAYCVDFDRTNHDVEPATPSISPFPHVGVEWKIPAFAIDETGDFGFGNLLVSVGSVGESECGDDDGA